MARIRLNGVLNLICDELLQESKKLSKDTWGAGNEKVGHLSDFLEQHLSSVIACALRHKYTDYVIVEMPYYHFVEQDSELGNERADFYTYDSRQGAGIQIIGEVKLGGPGRSNNNTPSRFLRSVLWDVKKLWSVEQTGRFNRILVAVWEGNRDNTVSKITHNKCPVKVLQSFYNWIDSGWNDAKMPDFRNLVGANPDISLVMTRLHELVNKLSADCIKPIQNLDEKFFVQILAARF